MTVVSDYTALLSGATLTGSNGKAAFLTYSFTTQVPAYFRGAYTDAQLSTFEAPSQEFMDRTRSVIAQYGAASGITFFEVPAGQGDMNFVIFDLDFAGAAGLGYYPSNGNESLLASDVLVSSKYDTGPIATSVLLHEVGHALGFKHITDGDPVLAEALLNNRQTVMYGSDYTQLQSYDLQALNYMYGGADRDGSQVASWSWNANTFQLTQIGFDTAERIVGVSTSNVIEGRGGNDTLVGGRGADTLDGGDGNDSLFGGEGDVLIGGAGRDSFSIQNVSSFNFSINGGEGDDTLSINVENSEKSFDTAQLSVVGVESINIFSGSGNDILTQNSSMSSVYFGGGPGNDTLRAGAGTSNMNGGAGDDVLYAGTGFGFLYGGAGADRFVFATASTSTGNKVDQIEDFQTGIDVIDLSGMNPTNIAIQGAYLTATGTDGAFTLFVRQSFTLADIVTRSGVIAGTNANDVLIGSSASDTLSGYAGDDSLNGGAGDDVIDGGEGRDTLVGGGGADTLIGGLGDDLYIISTTETVVRENVGEGIDSAIISATNYLLTPGASVETLSAVAGTAAINIAGNEFSQTINGNDGANILSGNGGGDTLNGGLGDDVYRIFSTADVIGETGGFDTVYASGTSYFLYSTAEIEYLSTAQQSGTDPIYLVGNASAQVIAGNFGDNIINGRGTALANGVGDTLIGLAGNDVYQVLDQTDIVRENAGEGNDVVYAPVSYQLRNGTSIEALSASQQTASGAEDAITLRGNELGQTIVGNDAANVLDGRGGNDTLVGRGGADIFAFTTVLNGTDNVDTIQDFSTGDRIGLATDVFANVTSGGITASEFIVGAQAADADDRLIYNQATGQLYYDADGNGPGVAVLFAQLAGGTALTASSFIAVEPVGSLASA